MNTAVRLGLGLLMLMSASRAHPQYTGVSFTNTGLGNGLSQSSVVDICFDATGFAWLATQDGLNRYDGKDFMLIDKKFDDITTGDHSRLGRICSHGKHGLYLISKGGILEQLDLITQRSTPVNIPGLTPRTVFTCLLTRGADTLWLATDKGSLICYNTVQRRVVQRLSTPGAEAINHLFIDRAGALWIAGHGLWVYRDRVIHPQTLYTATGLTPVVSVVRQDSSGNLWAGTLGSGLYFKPAGSGAADERLPEIFGVFTGKGQPAGPVIPTDLVIEDLLPDLEGNLWIGTYGRGLYLLHRNGEVSQLLNDKRNPYSIGFNDVLTIRQDRDHGIWIGTDGGGLSYYNSRSNQFRLYSPSTVPPEIDIGIVRSITTSADGTIWAGTTNEGLTRINEQTNTYRTLHFKAYQEKISNPDRILALYTDAAGLIWIGTQGNGILLLDPATDRIVQWFHPAAQVKQSPGTVNRSAHKRFIPDATTWCFFPSAAGSAWVGTEAHGLCLIDKELGLVGAYRDEEQPGSEPDAIRCITRLDDSTLIIGLQQTGVRLFDLRTRRFSRLDAPAVNRFFEQGTGVKSLYCENEVLWIGTDGRGLLAWNKHTRKLSVITQQEGLPNNTIYGIVPDRARHLWVSTNKGLSRFRKDITGQLPTPSQFTNYTSAQGLQSNEFNTGAYHQAENGTIFFGGINGLNSFDPASFRQADEQVPVVFTRVLVDNTEPEGDSSAVYRKTIELSYQDHSLGISFAALDFSPVHQYHYFYRLAGYEKQWVDAGLRNYISYTNIPAGNYRFEVKYAREAGGPADPVSSLSVIVHAPFWKTWWFILGIILLIAGAIYGAWRYRLHQVVKLLQVRQHIAADLHDDIGSTLSNINILSTLSKNSLNNPGQAGGFLDRISEEVSTSSQSLDDIIWSINTHNDTWEETFSRMRRYAAEVFEGGQIRYELSLPGEIQRSKINMEKRRDLFLVYKEILNNIHKHAAATSVFIVMRFEDNRLFISITDNGKGFDPAGLTHRNGIRNMRRRVERWKGTLEIDSGPAGTSLRIRL